MILGDLNNLPTTKPMKKFSHEAYFSWKDHHKEEAASFIDEAARVTHKEGGGGCVWPPRSYACSFCKREFKSAQALGGHMNVHRRDRALLKQVININNHGNNISINNDNDPFLPSSSLPLKNNHDYSSISSFKSSRVGQNNNLSHLSVPRKMSSNFSSHQTSSHNNYHVSSTMKVNLRLQSQDAKEVKIRGERSCNDHAADDGCYLSYKRCKKNGDFVTLLPSFLDETIKLSNVKASKSMDDLDLELRLGNPQKVK